MFQLAPVSPTRNCRPKSVILLLIGRVTRGGFQELDFGGDKRRTNKCDVILNPSHCKILATLLLGTINFVLFFKRQSRKEGALAQCPSLNTLLGYVELIRESARRPIAATACKLKLSPKVVKIVAYCDFHRCHPKERQSYSHWLKNLSRFAIL